MKRWLVAILVCAMEMTAAWAAPVNHHYFTNREGLRLHYLEAGKGPQTLVLVPGWLMPAAVFRAQLEALGDDFRVLAFDPRSQGESAVAQTPHDPARRLADLADFWAAADIQDAVLGGWSLGVLEVLDFLRRTPPPGLRGLVLIDNSVGEGTPPAASPAKGGGDRDRQLADPKAREAYLRAFCQGIFATPPAREMADAVLNSALRVPPEAARQLLAQPYPRTYWRDSLAQQTVPVWYAIRPRWREQAEALKAKRGDLVEVTEFPGAGHALFVDQAGAFNARLRAFLHRAFTSRPVSPPESSADSRPSDN